MSAPLLPRIQSKSLGLKTQSPKKSSSRDKTSKQLRTKVEQLITYHKNIKLMNSFLQSSPVLYGRSASLKRRVQTEVTDNNGHFLDPSKILLVSSSKWVIFDAIYYKYIRGFKNEEQSELRGFSKLLTLYCVYAICQKYVIDPMKFDCFVTKSAELSSGLKGYLNRYYTLSLEALIYIMTMEESNQSEYVIAINMGAYLNKRNEGVPFSLYDVERGNERINLQTFCRFMNSTAKILDLNLTHISSLTSDESRYNTTCANDIGKLSFHCSKLQIFNRITYQRQMHIKISKVGEDGELKTRSLLMEGSMEDKDFLYYKYICKNDSRRFSYSSCSCLYELDTHRIVIVLLNSHSDFYRKKDMQKAIEWYLKKMGIFKGLEYQ